MASKWIETLTGSLEQKRNYKEYRRRIGALPEPYRSAARAFERYLMYCGGVITDDDTLGQMLNDFADLWERAAADETPLREIVGDDPVDMAESFAQAYRGKQWVDKERARLVESISALET